MTIKESMTVASYIDSLLPARVVGCPTWPPDLFAVVASIAESTGFYAEPGIVLSTTKLGRKLKRAWADRTVDSGTKWRTHGTVPQEVEELWRRLAKLASCPLSEKGSTRARTWKRIAAHLLAIADEASSGIGFFPERHNVVAQIAFDQLALSLRGKPTFLRCPSSICLLIDPDKVCVMPKSLTPRVGCTLRSLTHNLALLPSQGMVSAQWVITASAPERDDAAPKSEDFNILVVPFPYNVSRVDFQEAKGPDGNADGYFELRQGWLNLKRPMDRTRLAQFLADLVGTASRKLGGGVVHAVVLPETALDPDFADTAFKKLSSSFPGIEALIFGILEEGKPLAKNKARLYLSRASRAVDQSKHHRWVLNGSQIRQYQLGRTLHPDKMWWENIDVSNRCMAFALIRQDIVVSTLVCEDLARFDPVLPVINAIGPNLVVALLMDGPQLQARWPGRYATVLAEDPGSSVLTVTCLGMARLARRVGEPENRVVALWKDAGGEPARELYLPTGAHGLLLCLASESHEQTTMDLRSDGSATVSLRLNEVWPVASASPPAWLSEA